MNKSKKLTQLRTHRHFPNRPTLAEALLKLENSNYKLTKSRRALLEIIIKQTKPFSVATLEKFLNGKRGCDQVTIYRTIPVFVELGIIEKCEFTNEVAFYEVVLGRETHHHHHIVCTNCEAVEPLDFCLIEAEQSVLQKLGYKNLKHKLEFSGICPKCA